jgi:hypothetical protein
MYCQCSAWMVTYGWGCVVNCLLLLQVPMFLNLVMLVCEACHILRTPHFNAAASVGVVIVGAT